MILVELSKLLKDGKIDKHASRSSQFLQLVDAVFDEAAREMPIEEQDEDTRTDEEQLLDYGKCRPIGLRIPRAFSPKNSHLSLSPSNIL